MAVLTVSSPISLYPTLNIHKSLLLLYPFSQAIAFSQSSTRHFPRHWEYKTINTNYLHQTNPISKNVCSIYLQHPSFPLVHSKIHLNPSFFSILTVTFKITVMISVATVS